MGDDTLPKYFVIVMAIYAAVLLYALFVLSPVFADAAILIVPMLIPAILFGVYILKFSKRWLRLLTAAAGIVAAIFTLVFIIPFF